MNKFESYLTLALVAATILACFSVVFSYVAIAIAFVVVVDSLVTNVEYMPMISLSEARAAA